MYIPCASFQIVIQDNVNSLTLDFLITTEAMSADSPPVFSGTNIFNIRENSANGNPVGTVLVSDDMGKFKIKL